MTNDPIRTQLQEAATKAQGALDAYDAEHNIEVSLCGMFDCHLFTRYEGIRSIDELKERWLAHLSRTRPLPREDGLPYDMGPPMLCPAIVLVNGKEVRRVGHVVFPREDGSYDEAALSDYLKALEADPDISRVLAEKGSKGRSK